MKLVLQIFELKIQTMKTASVARECKDDLGLCRHECVQNAVFHFLLRAVYSFNLFECCNCKSNFVPEFKVTRVKP